MRYIELLSPARDIECGIAAIDHGADAVYIGARRYGARADAGNGTEDIADLCRYAHQYGARVYVALNTILYDSELEDTRNLAWDLYHSGVDAFIVQDMATLGMDMPPVPLHASTQMDNRTPGNVLTLSSLGFTQVVLARELSLRQIRDIHQTVPGMRLEAFLRCPWRRLFTVHCACRTAAGAMPRSTALPVQPTVANARSSAASRSRCATPRGGSSNAAPIPSR